HPLLRHRSRPGQAAHRLAAPPRRPRHRHRHPPLDPRPPGGAPAHPRLSVAVAGGRTPVHNTRRFERVGRFLAQARRAFPPPHSTQEVSIRMRSRNIALAVLALCAVSLMASADEARKPGIYPLATCPVSGEKLNAKGDPIVRQIDGREIRFCCEGCVAKFEADKETFLKKIDAEIIAQQKDSYPTEKCIDMPEDD